jgi:CheY-like chemotaxis protein
MRTLIQEWLSGAGYHVCLAAPRDIPPCSPASLVIVSVYLPKLTGAEWLRNIRAAYPGAPIIAISGHFRPGLSPSGATAQALGVQQVIAKPLIRSDLLDAVRAMIGIAD